MTPILLTSLKLSTLFALLQTPVDPSYYNDGVLFKIQREPSFTKSCPTKNFNCLQSDRMDVLEPFLWMSEFPSKKRLCQGNHCKALSCKMYQLSSENSWHSTASYSVDLERFNMLKRWCDWENEESADSLRKSVMSNVKNIMMNVMIFPGTRWCGYGNRARNYNDLGANNRVDACCREHDMCPMFIPSGSCVQNKMAPQLCNNSSITMSHCDCDIKLQQCLSQINSTTAEIIMNVYFNLVGGRCFAQSGPLDDFYAFALKTPPNTLNFVWKNFNYAYNSIRNVLGYN